MFVCAIVVAPFVFIRAEGLIPRRLRRGMLIVDRFIDSVNIFSADQEYRGLPNILRESSANDSIIIITFFMYSFYSAL